MRKSRLFWTPGLFSLVLIACSTPHILVDPSLETNSTQYEVQGRNGWLINQQLHFGPYETGKVKRSWIKGYDYPFIIRFTGAREKLSYSLSHNQGSSAEIFCLASLTEQDLRIFHEYFDINLNSKDVFSGTVIVDKQDDFDFYITDLNQNNWVKAVNGKIANDKGDFEIRPISRLDNNKKVLSSQSPGFEFVLNNQVVGAVETFNKGRIWLHNDLSNTQRMALAGVTTALLLRSDLSDHNDDNL